MHTKTHTLRHAPRFYALTVGGGTLLAGAALALASLVACTDVSAVSNAVACADGIKAAITVPAGQTDTQKAENAILAAALNDYCIGLGQEAVDSLVKQAAPTAN